MFVSEWGEHSSRPCRTTAGIIVQRRRVYGQFKALHDIRDYNFAECVWHECYAPLNGIIWAQTDVCKTA